MVLLSCVVGESGFVVFFKLDARWLLVNVSRVLDSTSVLCSCNLSLYDSELPSSFTDVGLVTICTRNFVHTFCYIFLFQFLFWMYYYYYY